MKKLILLFLIFSSATQAQDLTLLKQMAFTNTNSEGAVTIANEVLKYVPGYSFDKSSKQAQAYFVTYKNNQGNTIDVVFSDNDGDGVYAFSSLRGVKNDIINLWKSNFNAKFKSGAFTSYDRYKNKENGLNFSIHINDTTAEIKDFS